MTSDSGRVKHPIPPVSLEVSILYYPHWLSFHEVFKLFRYIHPHRFVYCLSTRPTESGKTASGATDPCKLSGRPTNQGICHNHRLYPVDCLGAPCGLIDPHNALCVERTPSLSSRARALFVEKLVPEKDRQAIRSSEAIFGLKCGGLQRTSK